MAHRLLRDVEADGWERSDFPIICESCLGDNPYVRMVSNWTYQRFPRFSSLLNSNFYGCFVVRYFLDQMFRAFISFNFCDFGFCVAEKLRGFLVFSMAFIGLSNLGIDPLFIWYAFSFLQFDIFDSLSRVHFDDRSMLYSVKRSFLQILLFPVLRLRVKWACSVHIGADFWCFSSYP